MDSAHMRTMTNLDDPWTWVGFVAAACTSLSLLPQVWQAYRRRSVQGVSRRMGWIYTGSVLLWLVYGVLRGDLPILVANAVSLGLAVALLVAQAQYGSRWGGRRIRPDRAAATDLPDARFTRRS